jgi:Polyketide cyclase / dehydrase and lipid transport
MLKGLGITAIVAIAPVAGLLAYAATTPDTFRIQRTASIKAPPEKIFAFINDMRAWVRWSPFEKKDPDMKRIFSGAEAGKGSFYEWDGDRNIGRGRLAITDTAPPFKVVVDMHFIRPFEAYDTAEFTLEPHGDMTTVTWEMRGPVPYVGKIVHLFVNMDRMLGNEFDAGLENLKALTERDAVSFAQKRENRTANYSRSN